MTTSMSRAKPKKSERLGLRASHQQRALLVAASEAEGLTVSDFILSHATRAAEAVLADQRIFVTPSEVWERFAAALDRPAVDVPGLAQLMNTPTILDQA